MTEIVIDSRREGRYSMSAIFVDTSSLVKFYYPGTDSDKIESAYLKAAHLYIICLTMFKFASTLSKKYVRRFNEECGNRLLEYVSR
jgi:predicted nucleic acid-binding protein